ncbi:BrnT family toxin [Methylobacterium sp. JK268]
MDFDWNPLKEAEVRARRGHGFSAPVRIFLDRTVEWEDDREDYGEIRMIAVGRAEGRFWTVVYTDREDADGPFRWIITAWPSDRRERERWHAGA